MKLKLLGLVALSLSCISATVAPIKNTEPSFDGYTVDFFNNYLREDVVEKPLDRDVALKNASDVVDGQIRLPKVVG